MADKLTEFLTRNDACIEVLVRLAATGARGIARGMIKYKFVQ